VHEEDAEGPTVSLLFPGGAGRADTRDEPAAGAGRPPTYLADLNLDQVVTGILRRRNAPGLAALFHRRERDPEVITYRHEVFRDLEDDRLEEAVDRFATAMRRVHRLRDRARSTEHVHERASWLLDSARTYVAAVRRLDEALDERPVTARALRSFRDHLAAHVRSDPFDELAAETTSLTDDLAQVRYALHLGDDRITVTRDEDEVDYGQQVAATFERFRQRTRPPAADRRPQPGPMNDVEAQILDHVGRLYPDRFAALTGFAERHADPLDPTVVEVAREAGFYLAYREYTAPLRRAGLPFCYPELTDVSEDLVVEGAFDLALAHSLATRGTAVVCNDVELRGPERILVVSGANQGGKTTFARTVGQLHHLAALGCPVPGRAAQLALPDHLFTHFAHEERLEDRRGRLQDDLLRIHGILEQATSDSLVILNELFSSTTLVDARTLGTRVIGALTELGARCVYVTFVDELATLGETVVSMVASVHPDDPAVRTYEVVRRPADGRAYARALAEKHQLTYEELLTRVRP
jgi:DNA mismatch repair protein MutS